MNFTTLNEFPEGNKSKWNGWISSGITQVPFLRYEYLKNWWLTRGGGEWPKEAQLLILQASQEGEVIGYAPCFVAEHDGKKALLFLGCIEISDYLDFLVSPQQLTEFCQGFVEYVRSTLVPQLGIQRIDLYNLLEGSPTLPALQQMALAQGLACHIQPLVQAPHISLPGNWDAYLESIDKKQRHEIRRKMRRMQELQPRADWYIASDPAKIEAEIQDFLRLMAFDPEKEKFLTPSMREAMELIMREAFASGILQLTFLTIGGEKAAAYLNFDFMNRIWVYNSGIDPRFSEHSPGWVLLGHLLQWANEHGRDEFDFMRGNEEYKYRFGAVDRHVMRLTIDL